MSVRFGGGGQIVLSSATARVLESSLPPGARLRGLGEQRLQGLPEPVTLFRLESGAG